MPSRNKEVDSKGVDSPWTDTTPIRISTDPNEDRPGYEIVVMQLPPGATAGKSKLFLRVLAQGM